MPVPSPRAWVQAGRAGPHTVALVIGVLLVGLSTCHESQRLRAVGPARVVSCHVYESHGANADVRLENGRRVVLNWELLSEPDKCLPVGTMLEKRRGEVGYRINGALQPHANADVFRNFLVLGLVFLALAGGLEFLARRARGKPP